MPSAPGWGRWCQWWSSQTRCNCRKRLSEVTRNTEEDLPVKIASLCDGPWHNGGAGGSKGALKLCGKYVRDTFLNNLEEKTRIFWIVYTNKEKIFISNETASVSKSKSISTKKEREPTWKHKACVSFIQIFIFSTKAQVCKVFDEDICNIFTSYWSSFNETKSSLSVWISLNFFQIQNYKTCINIIKDPFIVRKKPSKFVIMSRVLGS